MIRSILIAALGALLMLPPDVVSRGPRGGGGGGRPGGGGGRPGGGGGARPATPSFSRPAMPAQRPSMPAQRPNFSGGGGARPSFGPSGGQTLNLRPPSTPQTRPGTANRPSQLPAPGNRPGIGDRPGIADRPGAGGGGIQRPSQLPSGGNRPGIANRPDRPNLGPDRPGAGGGGVPPSWLSNRPNVGPDRNGLRPDINANRPNMNIGNRVTQNNINNVNVNRWNQYNRQTNMNRQWWNQNGNWNRPWYGNRPASNWGRPWYNQHYGWHNGYWNYWARRPGLWLGAGVAAGWLLSPGDNFAYSNPYYAEPAEQTVVVQQPALDYSNPIPEPTVDQTVYAFPPPPDVAEDGTVGTLPTGPPPPPETGDENVTEANRLFDAARDAFKGGDYARAQDQVEKAIAKLPSDATLHEFRALTLFAQGKYKEAAATLYAVLAAGPGWDWETMRGLYSDAGVYTRQMRALEEYQRKNPDAGYAHFLLAYHYLVLGSKDEAVRQLREAVRVEPNDKLSAALIKALTSDASAEAPAPGKVG
jgi:tetratricopeptide (TPR) repeat protein